METFHTSRARIAKKRAVALRVVFLAASEWVADSHIEVPLEYWKNSWVSITSEAFVC